MYMIDVSSHGHFLIINILKCLKRTYCIKFHDLCINQSVNKCGNITLFKMFCKEGLNKENIYNTV